MRLRFAARSAGMACLLAGTLITTPTPAAAAQTFDGAGYGPTSDYAVQAAIWDAEESAGAFGFYSCEMVGDPQVFPGAPGSRRAFRAQVTLSCS